VDATAPGYRVIELHADGRIESDVIRLPGQITGLQMNSQGY
jgi:Icc protein